jgi:hypothetical protein
MPSRDTRRLRALRARRVLKYPNRHDADSPLRKRAADGDDGDRPGSAGGLRNTLPIDIQYEYTVARRRPSALRGRAV